MLNESTLFALWAGAAVKSTVVLGIAWLIAFVLRRRSAAVRHLVWTAASVAVLALPFFSLCLPALRIPSVASLAPGAAAFFEATATVTGDVVPPRVHPRYATTATDRPVGKRLGWGLLLVALLGTGR